MKRGGAVALVLMLASACFIANPHYDAPQAAETDAPSDSGIMGSGEGIAPGSSSGFGSGETGTTTAPRPSAPR